MSIAHNVEAIRKDIPENVRLIAVSKTKSLDEMKEAYDIGIRDFGENKVQEFLSKYDSFGDDINWHFIGHLQVNKVKYIVGKVKLIHSLDSIKLLSELEKRYSKAGLKAEVLIEVNIGREESKSGILLEDLEELLSQCENCSSVEVKGLMAVIPKGNEEDNRKYFSEMKSIFEKLKNNKFKNVEMKYLSMGMTGDYKIAIAEGANMVRIGQGIFGKRNYNVQGG